MKEGYSMYYEDRDSILIETVEEFEKILGRELTEDEYCRIADKFEVAIEPFTLGWRNYN